MEFSELIKIVGSFNIPMTKDNLMKKFQVRSLWRRYYAIEWEICVCLYTPFFSQDLCGMHVYGPIILKLGMVCPTQIAPCLIHPQDITNLQPHCHFKPFGQATD